MGGMYVRTVTRRGKSGVVSYVQLARNEWDPVRKRSVAKVVCGLGRADQVDRAGISRLIGSLGRVIGQDVVGGGSGGVARPVWSRPMGGGYVLDGVWRGVGLDECVVGSGQNDRGRRRDLLATERVLFALVANRALAPCSKLAAVEWMTKDVVIPGLDGVGPVVDEDACYRVMDWLSDHEAVFSKRVFDRVCSHLDLEVDLVFFDTTSTYFEIDTADDDGFRTWGKSKDSRDDLPQIVIGMAVTRTGIPVRVWCWPGNTADQGLIRQVRSDMRDWTLSRIIWCADRGFTSERNRRELMRAGGGYILGEKLRSGCGEAQAVLSTPGRYHTVAGHLRVKEVHLRNRTGVNDRFIICVNPDQVERDKTIRDHLVARLHQMIDHTDSWSATRRAELKGRISTMPGLNRYLRVTPTGLLRVDKTKIINEASLDGKYLLRCSDPHMSPTDIALGYKQLLQVERGWRDMKSTLNLRPVWHRLEHRIRAHVSLCWLALLLTRIIENTTGQPWTHTRQTMQRLHHTAYTTGDTTLTITTQPTPQQTNILTQLCLSPPPAITHT